jgi:glycosyltransferase involved in cell wall biosynthesis
MRIRVGIDAHTVGARQTGNETYVRRLIEALCELPDPSAERIYYHTGAERLPSRFGRARRVWPHSPFVRVPVSLPLALWRDCIDVAHFQYIAPPLCPCPVVVVVHDVSFARFPHLFPTALGLRLRALVPRSLRRAAHVLTISEFSKSEIVECFGIDPSRITVTPLAAGPEFHPAGELEQDGGEVTALGVSEPYVLAVGNLQPRKNLLRLLAAYALLRDRGERDHRLVLVGQRGSYGGEIEMAIARLRLTEHVVLTGYVSDAQLVALYRGASLFVYPSLYEGFGLPIVEAMACGTPVVTSNLASMPEVAGDAALLADPTSVDTLADAMSRVLSDSTLRARMRTDGLRRSAQFSWSRTAQQTLAVYLEHARRRSPGHSVPSAFTQGTRL